MQAIRTISQIQIVRESFALLAPNAETAAALFYQRLFELDPKLRPLFRGDMTVQGRKLMSMIEAAVRGLDNLSLLVTAVQNLGRRHASYGVSTGDYQTVRVALLWMLRHGLGDAFTPAVEESWVAVYGVLADIMIAAAEGEMLAAGSRASCASIAA